MATITTTVETTVEAEELVNHIVDGKLVPCRWDDLTEDEKRAARANLYNLYDF